MFDDDLTARKKMSKARTQLVLDDPFFGSVSMGFRIYEDEWGYTDEIVTNGKWIIYNKDYIDKLTIPEIKYELAGLCGHIMLKHHLRSQSRDVDMWNRAADLVIDNILKEAGYTPPKRYISRIPP